MTNMPTGEEIAVLSVEELEARCLTGDQAAFALGRLPITIRKLVTSGVIPSYCPAPWPTSRSST